MISREDARMYAKIMIGDYYCKFSGVDNYCPSELLMADSQALRIEYLTLTKEMHKIAKPNLDMQIYDDETRKWIKGRMRLAKTYLDIEREATA